MVLKPNTFGSSSKSNKMPLKRKASSDNSSQSSCEEKKKRIPIRSKHIPQSLAVTVHPVPQQRQMIISICPPKEPEMQIPHVPCDIVLVIDVSGSMQSSAPVPGGDAAAKDEYGLSVLDLTKHAARTILHTLNENDRLGIVTFSSNSKIVQKLLPMDEKNKAAALQKIGTLRCYDSTNLWHGILAGIKLFKDGPSNSSNVPAMMVLTDGMPNHMCPAQGYVPKLRAMQLPATIHTFGFGYSIRSGLLKSIAEIGGGNYSFIPDAGMIGTVFVHAIANLQSTYATSAILTVESPAAMALVEAMGDSVLQQPPTTTETARGKSGILTIHLGNLQYGQSRDICLEYDDSPQLRDLLANSSACIVAAELRYTDTSRAENLVFASANLRDPTSLPTDQIAYHTSRAAICSFLCSLFPIRPDGERSLCLLKEHKQKRIELSKLIESIPSADFALEPLNVSLMNDLSGLEPMGQVTLALEDKYLGKWGMHYLLSLLNAHTRQICNTFKDPGPLQYGTKSPLFQKCRDELDAAFDTIKPPKPSRQTNYRGRVNMKHYNSSNNSCFAGFCPVLLDTGKSIPIRQLRPGMQVKTPVGKRRVAAVLQTPVRDAEMCWVGDLCVTPWHPLSVERGCWKFPSEVADGWTRYSGSVYSLLLQPDANENSHGVYISNRLAVTMGHGILNGSDARAHSFFGNYKEVLRSLKSLRKERSGVLTTKGVKRDRNSGLICGFRKEGMKANVSGRVKALPNFISS